MKVGDKVHVGVEGEVTEVFMKGTEHEALEITFRAGSKLGMATVPESMVTVAFKGKVHYV